MIGTKDLFKKCLKCRDAPNQYKARRGEKQSKQASGGRLRPGAPPGRGRGKGGINMAEFTPNYGLHQWQPADKFLRTDFNEDFKKIDTAVHAAKQSADSKARIITGSYTGTGSGNVVINVGQSIKFLAIAPQNDEYGLCPSGSVRGWEYSGIWFQGTKYVAVIGDRYDVTEYGYGVSIENANYLNRSGTKYSYIAFV